MRKTLFYLSLVGLCFAAGMAGSYTVINSKMGKSFQNKENTSFAQSATASLIGNNQSQAVPNNFNLASEQSTPTVVYIKTTSTSPSRSFDDWFFGGFFNQPQTVINSGSGVIVSKDGYIVTNNHVIEKATKVEVILNNKQSFEATVIGTDPSTDLALLKINSQNNLTAISFFNSNEVKVGDWVLAVGNPFNLTSTVTAGIVSAKGRNLNILNNLFPIESFIQTDAAINPGNSGGALVNLNGELVGINTAIYSRTGSYNGYGFAIPANIVSKVIRDLKEYGAVQRAFVEAVVIDVDNAILEKLKLNGAKGVFVSEVSNESNAKKAGLKKEDLILQIDGTPINSKAEFDEQISYRRPGEKINMQIFRKGERINIAFMLTNSEGTTDLVKQKEIATSDKLGADFEAITKLERDKFKTNNGFRITNIRNGIIRRMGLRDGFIITHINKIELTESKQVIDLLENMRGNIVIEGINPDGRRTYHSFYTY